MTKNILELLHDNSKLTAKEIAVMIDKPEAEVAAAIAELEKNKIIVSYKTTINWEKTDYEKVSALIELKVTPQRGGGFEAIAEKIYNYPEVSSLYLMSGAYDIMVIVEGKTMKDVALFV
ncbi:MAG: Lrp/AsnC family transcriptional regulator, partial [Clostridia bacterium]|nr:Lrp/AsnC family transcriptional regulator [Clostridia bacterium]